MRKSVIAVAVAAVLWTPGASGQTILQKTDWRAKPPETYLPPPISVPGPDVDIRTKPPKRHLPTDWQAPGLLCFQVNSSSSDARVTSTAAPDLGRM